MCYLVNMSLAANAPGTVLNPSRAPVVVGTEDIQGLVLTAALPNVVTGHIVFDFDDRQTLRFPAAATRIVARQLSPRVTADASREGRVNSDWSFEFQNLLGRRLFRFDELPLGWVVKSVVLNHEDVTDYASTVPSGPRCEGRSSHADQPRLEGARDGCRFTGQSRSGLRRRVVRSHV